MKLVSKCECGEDLLYDLGARRAIECKCGRPNPPWTQRKPVTSEVKVEDDNGTAGGGS